MVDQPATRSAVCGIVLAAGLSSRMGRFKPLLPIDGQRLLVQVVADAARQSLERVLVVVGHRGDEVRRHLRGRDVEVVDNPRYREGMLTSVQCGVATAGETGGYVICLGDQPRWPPGLIDRLIDTARSRGCGIALPVWEGRGGHPVYLAARYRQRILALTGDEGGLRAVTRGYPADTAQVEVTSSAVVEDLDTPAQYEKLMGSTGLDRESS